MRINTTKVQLIWLWIPISLENETKNSISYGISMLSNRDTNNGVNVTQPIRDTNILFRSATKVVHLISIFILAIVDNGKILLVS